MKLKTKFIYVCHVKKKGYLFYPSILKTLSWISWFQRIIYFLMSFNILKSPITLCDSPLRKIMRVRGCAWLCCRLICTNFGPLPLRDWKGYVHVWRLGQINFNFYCLPESFNTNISHKLFNYIMTFVNSQREKTNSKGDFIHKNRFETFVLKTFDIKKNKLDSDLVWKI